MTLGQETRWPRSGNTYWSETEKGGSWKRLQSVS